MERQERQKRHAGEIIPPAPPCFCLPASPVRQDRVNGKIMPGAKAKGESVRRKEVSQRSGARTSKKHFPVCMSSPRHSLPQLSGNPSFDTTVRRRPDRSRPPQVGPTGHTCTASADRTAHAKRPPRNRGLPNARASSATRPAFPPAPAEGAAFGGNMGGPGEIISDLADCKRAHNPVCARHAVRPASLARRRLRLTPEVNSGCLLPSAGLLTSPGAPVR